MYRRNVVCFRYVVGNTVHTGDDDDDNNNKHYKTNIMQHIYCKQKQVANADYGNIWRGTRAHCTNVPNISKRTNVRRQDRACAQLDFNIGKEIGLK